MISEYIYKVLLSPHISEKSTIVSDKNRQFVFKVLRNAEKPQIKKAVEELFKVSVEAVCVSNVKSKSKRFGNIEGRRKAWKKAYVTLAPGNDINFVGIEK